MAKIVVGVDASPGALRALAWAADEARLRLATLQVVHAYHAQALAAPLYFPSQEGLPGRAVAAGGRAPEEEMAETLEQRAEFQEAVRRQAEDLLEGLLDEVGDAVEGVDVQRSVVEDRNPAEALVELSAGRRAAGRRLAGPGRVHAACCWGRSATPPCCMPAARWW